MRKISPNTNRTYIHVRLILTLCLWVRYVTSMDVTTTEPLASHLTTISSSFSSSMSSSSGGKPLVTTSGNVIFTTSSQIHNKKCENATEMIIGCLNDFSTYYKLNLSNVDNSTRSHFESLFCSDHSLPLNCSTGKSLNKSDCQSVNNLLLANVTYNYAFKCSTKGLEVEQVSTSDCSEAILGHYSEINKVFCGMVSSLVCKAKNSTNSLLASSDVIKPLNDKCFPKTTPKEIPLLLNPVSPDGITAIVVIICLTIIFILAGFFFWPKCHNPKAGWFPKKKSKYSTDIKTVAYPNSNITVKSVTTEA